MDDRFNLLLGDFLAGGTAHPNTRGSCQGLLSTYDSGKARWHSHPKGLKRKYVCQLNLIAGERERSRQNVGVATHVTNASE